MKIPLFTGACTAMVTPFLNGHINYPMLNILMQRQIDAGMAAAEHQTCLRIVEFLFVDAQNIVNLSERACNIKVDKIIIEHTLCAFHKV